jgi:hypothetical protein
MARPMTEANSRRKILNAEVSLTLPFSNEIEAQPRLGYVFWTNKSIFSTPWILPLAGLTPVQPFEGSARGKQHTHDAESRTLA